MMPPGGAEARGESMALMAAIAHQRITDPKLGAFLDLAEGRNKQLESLATSQRAGHAPLATAREHGAGVFGARNTDSKNPM